KPLGHFWLVTDVSLHNIYGIVEDIVDRQCHSTVDRLDALCRGRRLLGHEQLKRVERGRHVTTEDLEELQVTFGERAGLGTLDVERADHLVMQEERHSQRT